MSGGDICTIFAFYETITLSNRFYLVMLPNVNYSSEQYYSIYYSC